jgi:hypothetical protein
MLMGDAATQEFRAETGTDITRSPSEESNRYEGNLPFQNADAAVCPCPENSITINVPSEVQCNDAFGLNRAQLSRFFAAKFPSKPMFRGTCNSNAIRHSIELEDPMVLNEITISILGASFKTGCPSNIGLRFSYSFFNFKSVQSNTMHFHDDGMKDVPWPAILYNRSSNFDGYHETFLADIAQDLPHSSILPSDPIEIPTPSFVKYLADACVTIEIHDAHSALPIGRCELPLKSLLRQKSKRKAEVHASFIYPTWNQSEPACTIGTLFVQLENCGKEPESSVFRNWNEVYKAKYEARMAFDFRKLLSVKNRVQLMASQREPIALDVNLPLHEKRLLYEPLIDEMKRSQKRFVMKSISSFRC